MNNIFHGRKKYLTFPIFALLGLVFLPLTIIIFAAWFTKRNVKNLKVRKILYSILGIIALPFLASYAIAFTSPSPSTTSQPTLIPLIQTFEQQQTPVPTTPNPILLVTAAPEFVMSTTIAKPTVKPTIFVTASPRPTIEPTTAPRQTLAPASGKTYSCDCSRTCTEIPSCAEAQYQLNKCGCSARDNDHDGIACDGAPLHCQQ